MKKRKVFLLFMILVSVLLSSVVLNIMAGSVDISPSELVHIVLGHEMESPNSFIIWNIRIPRTMAAALGGAYLAVSGLLLQVFFRNPIVGPFILGISSGATLMVSLVMLTTLSLGFSSLSPFMSVIAALVGAYGVMLIVIVIAVKVKDPLTLLIVGLMMGYLCHALTSVLTAFARQERLKMFVLWQLGSFAGLKWAEIQCLLFFGGLVLALVYLMSKPLNAFLLGESYAASMGLDIRSFRLFIVFCSCALSGMVTAVAGPVAFVGLAVPHMARLCFVTSDNRILIPAAVLLGAISTCLCDLVARLAFSPVELPISAITAIFGAPIVIALLLKRRMTI